MEGLWFWLKVNRVDRFVVVLVRKSLDLDFVQLFHIFVRGSIFQISDRLARHGNARRSMTVNVDVIKSLDVLGPVQEPVHFPPSNMLYDLEFCKVQLINPPMNCTIKIHIMTMPKPTWKSPIRVQLTPKLTMARNPLIQVMMVSTPMQKKWT